MHNDLEICQNLAMTANVANSLRVQSQVRTDGGFANYHDDRCHSFLGTI